MPTVFIYNATLGVTQEIPEETLDAWLGHGWVEVAGPDGDVPPNDGDVATRLEGRFGWVSRADLFSDSGRGTLGVSGFDDVDRPLSPEAWIPVSHVYEAARSVGVWVVGSLIDVIGPSGPGYTMVGTFTSTADIEARDTRYQTGWYTAISQGATMRDSGSVGTTLSGTGSDSAASQGNPRATRLTSTTNNGATNATQPVCVGASSNWSTAGWRHTATVRFPDASYNETGASTGTRFGIGVSSTATIGTILGADTLGGSFVGFLRRHVNGGTSDTNWRIVSRNGSTLYTADTGVAFAVGRWLTFDHSVAAGGSTIYWSIHRSFDGDHDDRFVHPDRTAGSSDDARVVRR